MASARQLGAEFLGTALLLATVVGSGVMAEMLAGGNVALALLCNTIPTGAMLAVLILVLGPVSGAHLNPAVTLSFVVRGGMRPAAAGLYVATQVAAALAGVWLAHLMFDLSVLQVSAKVRSGTGQWVSEVVATFGLVLAIHGTARRGITAVAAAVGLYISAAYWFTASTSFANPAVTIGRSLTNTFSGIQPPDMPAFLVAQCIGALLATAAAAWLIDDEALIESG